jgi:hypothetical protein
VGHCAAFCAAYRAKTMTKGRIFFSEEKKHKTFIPPQLPIGWLWRARCRQRRNKSFLVLFFKKELLP